MENKAKWITVTFLLLTTLVYAQRNKVDTLHTYWIDEVTVTSSKKLSKEIIPVQIMEGAQLEKLSVHSVADAIRYFSAYKLKTSGVSAG